MSKREREKSRLNSKVSTSYPYADKSVSSDAHMSGSSSTTAMIFCRFDINLIQKDVAGVVRQRTSRSGLIGRRERCVAAESVQSCAAPRAQ